MKRLEIGGRKSDVGIVVPGLTVAGATIHAAGAPDNGEQITASGLAGPTVRRDNRAAASSSGLSTLNSQPSTFCAAFTIIELLVVTGIIALLMVLVVPAFTNIKSAGDVTSAAYTIKGVLEQARSYAMASNTYVWVGFYEEATTATAPTNAPPPYAGKGRVLLATVASKDGTASGAVTQVGKLIKIESIHMTDIGPPPSPTPFPTPDPSSVNARSGVSYYIAGTSTLDPLGYQKRINSDDTHSPDNRSVSQFTAQGYTFYKTIRFSPRGEPSIDVNGSYALANPAEIGLRPTHGTAVDNNTPNVIAIQFGGAGGSLKIYRR